MNGLLETMGCLFHGCRFSAAGEKMKQAMRDHLVEVHNIDPTNPEIPADARRAER